MPDAIPTWSPYIVVFKNVVPGQHVGAVGSVAAPLLQGPGALFQVLHVLPHMCVWISSGFSGLAMLIGYMCVYGIQ